MLDKYKEQILLTEMEKACLVLGPEAFLELVHETFSRAKLATEDLGGDMSHCLALHEAAIECVILNLEDPAPEEELTEEQLELTFEETAENV